MIENIEALIFRYDPSEDVSPRYEKYEIPYKEGMSVLEVLKFISEEHSPLAFRYACRIKSCGTCAVMVNKNPVLACKEKAKMSMTIEPLPIFPVIKDLVVDIDSYNEKRLKIRPFIERYEKSVELPRVLTYETVNAYRECEICIKCFICDVSCPVVRENRQRFAGPSLMIELAKLNREPQDNGDRIKIALSEGLNNCDLCGNCTEACPVEIKVHEIIKNLQNLAKNL